ncbi:MAG: 3'(2'),5'-bisphosphate nucleotidase CysQ [Solirubrobacteraceae bacterium]|nr:3'(2'),5'-bisphosphate nucleotidase CysQ [Solirubrobacteraceae bacterium]
MDDRVDLSDDRLARDLAEAAGQALLAARTHAPLRGRALGDVGDAMAHELIVGTLRALRPDDAVRSEEDRAPVAPGAEDRRIWIVDPLDGTREFREGRDDWAVHVALVVAGSPGPSAVALPGLGVVLSSADVAPPPPAPGPRPRIAVSRTRPPAAVDHLRERIDVELVPMGSAGYKTSAVVRGEADAYVHAGGQFEWDSAAPVGVALAAGLHASRIDGSPLRYDGADAWLPDLLVCRPELAPDLLAALADAPAEPPRAPR